MLDSKELLFIIIFKSFISKSLYIAGIAVSFLLSHQLIKSDAETY